MSARSSLATVALVSMIAVTSIRASGADGRPSEGAIIDTLVLGDSLSEQNHRFRNDRSEVVAGGLGESARQLLPSEPVSFAGGTITFTLKVDPERQNYFTVKLWGSDKGAERGRFMLYSGNLQLGYRHEGDHDILNQTSEEGQCPGRFAYQTIILPISMTRGKSDIELTIRSFGPVWNYGENFDRFQKPLTASSRGIYRVYTHTSQRFVPLESEQHGKLAPAGTRPAPGEEIIAQSRKIVIDRLNGLLKQVVSDPGPRADGKRNGRMGLLSEAYTVEWTPAFKNPKVVDQMIQDGDDSIRRAAGDPKVFDGTWQALGPVAGSLINVWPAIKDRMDEKIDLGVEGASTRREAWAIMIHRGMNYLRTHRRGFTNQSMIVDAAIYASNRGLMLLKPDLAIPEAKAMRYMYESVGIEPWFGSNKTDPNDSGVVLEDEFERPYGSNYHTVTRKGLSRELGWVASYGETILALLHDMVRLGGDDQKLRDQLQRIQTARFYFRYPALDEDGNRSMKITAEIDNRHTYYPRHGPAYLACEVGESWWMDTPAMFPDNPKIVGVAQQMLADNQYFHYIQSRLKDSQTAGMMRNVDDYEKVKALPPSSYRLPMTDGQPDFVFSDEENAVVVVKHGDTRIFANFYFRATFGVNGVVRILEVDSVNTRVATVRSEYKLENSAGTYKRPNVLHMMTSRPDSYLPPPPVPNQAWEGEEIPVAAPPQDANGVTPGKWGPFVGKAPFYQLRYGDYLFAINTTENRSYEVTIPADAPSTATDLVSGKAVQAGQTLTLKPLSTAVVYVGKQ